MKMQHLIARGSVLLISLLFAFLYLSQMWWVGFAFGAALIGIDLLLRRVSLRRFNGVVLGLFLGYLLGMVLERVVRVLPVEGEATVIACYLMSLYLGVMVTLRASDALALSIPFVRFERQGGARVRSLLLDASVLNDERLHGVASTGLLDGRLVLPKFVERELGSEKPLKKLRQLPGLGLRVEETDFPELSSSSDKLVRLARLLGGDVLTAEVGVIGTHEDVRLINLHTLGKALRPLEQSGDCFPLRVQRYGKEEHQGVGYLDDGTMVVVNGGGDYIGDEISCRILSVKHTAAGRMIFCNVAEEA
jgi:uncharacterized protein YacL